AALLIGLTPGMVSACAGGAAAACAGCLCFAADALDVHAAQAIAPMAIATTVFLIMRTSCVPRRCSLVCGERRGILMLRGYGDRLQARQFGEAARKKFVATQSL